MEGNMTALGRLLDCVGVEWLLIQPGEEGGPGPVLGIF